jgi:hypothetical protein
MSDQQQLLDVLRRRQILSAAQAAEAEELARTTGDRIGDAVVKLGYATELEVLAAWAEVTRLPWLDLCGFFLPTDVVEMVPESVARENTVLPLAAGGGALLVAMPAPDPDVIAKLQFILNVTVHPVLAVRSQIVAAINRHYGQSETESVDSMLAEFTDTAIDFRPLPGAGEPPAAAAPKSAPAGPAPRVRRRVTVRHYHRMHPDRLFPLLVVLSQHGVRAVARPGVTQEQSRAFSATLGEWVEVEPILPGCSCYPPRDQVKVTAGEATATFWVAPHVLGSIAHARVVIRREAEVLAEVPLAARVARPTAAVLCGVLSLVLPVLFMVLKKYRLDFESQLEEDFALYAAAASWLLRSLTPEMIGGGCLLAAAALYWWLRPRPREVFWDLESVGPAEDEPPAPAPAPPAEPPADQRLPRARQCFTRGDYAQALPLYRQLLEQGQRTPEIYYRAALSAHFTGDTPQALALLKDARDRLPPGRFTPVMWYNMACYAARLGSPDEALRYLRHAIDAGYKDWDKLRSDPDLAQLRWRTPFKRLLASAGA